MGRFNSGMRFAILRLMVGDKGKLRWEEGGMRRVAWVAGCGTWKKVRNQPGMVNDFWRCILCECACGQSECEDGVSEIRIGKEGFLIWQGFKNEGSRASTVDSGSTLAMATVDDTEERASVCRENSLAGPAASPCAMAMIQQVIQHMIRPHPNSSYKSIPLLS